MSHYAETRRGGRHDNLVSTLTLTHLWPPLWKVLATPLYLTLDLGSEFSILMVLENKLRWDRDKLHLVTLTRKKWLKIFLLRMPFHIWHFHPGYIMYFWKENSNQVTFLGLRIGFVWCIILMKSNIILRKILMVKTPADSTRKWPDSRKLIYDLWFDFRKKSTSQMNRQSKVNE